MAVKTKQSIYDQSYAKQRGISFEDWLSQEGDSMKLPYTDDDYLAEIEQYKGKSWYDQLLTNPWLAGNQAIFSPNLGQNILSLFGDDSAEDKYYAELRSNRSQWLSEFLEKMRQQDYNSPLQQAQREQLAGINPDLAGNIEPGAAAENDQPMLGHPSFGQPFDIGQLGSFFMNIYSLASGFAKDAISMQSMMNQLTSEDLDINNKIIGVTTDYIKGHIGKPKKVDDGSGKFHYEFPDLSLDALDDYAMKMFRNRSTRNRFKKEVESSYSSSRSRFAQYGIMKNEEDALRALAGSVGENEALGGQFEPMVDVYRELNSMVYDIQKYQNKYTSEYFHSASGSKAGEAVNSQNQGIIDENNARSYQRGMDKIINETMERIVSKLERASKNGGLEGLIAQGMLGFISAYRLQMIPSLPSVNLQGLVQNRNFTTNNNTFSE